MKRTFKPAGIYARTLLTYAERAPFLLLLGAVVFVPLGLVDALADKYGSIDVNDVNELNDLLAAALLVGVVLQAATTLLGEVFFSGAVADVIARTPQDRKPSLRRLARTLSYGRLIAVDLVYGAAVAIGLILLIVPGVLVFTWLALAGPLVEIEGRGVRAAFKRSRELVRGHFWGVLAVLGPITLASEALIDAVRGGVTSALGHTLIADWFADSAANIAVSPFYAVAAVLMTFDLAGPKGGHLDSDRAVN